MHSLRQHVDTEWMKETYWEVRMHRQFRDFRDALLLQKL